MADVKRTIHVRVLTFDPAQGKMIGVPNAALLVEDDGFLWDPNLSNGNPTTDAQGKAQVEITFDEKKENTLNPYFTIEIPSANRTVPSGAPAARQFTLPEEWVTRHYVNRRIPRIGDHTDPNKPLEIFVGLDGHLHLSYSDFDASVKRNVFALPEGGPRIHLADYDAFIFDILNPDDTLKGFEFDPKANGTLAVGEREEYPYFDVWPTAPCALDGASPPAPRAWLDPPFAPVDSLGGGSFEKAGPVAVDAHGFVYMIDGQVVRRFYPDSTLCETITGPGPGVNFNNPGGLALDQYRNLFVADTGNDQIAIFQLEWRDGASGIYETALTPTFNAGGTLSGPTGLAVVPNRVVDGEEFLAVADSGNNRVQVFRIRFPGTPAPFRTRAVLNVSLTHLTTFGTAGANPGEFQNPVGVAADRQRRLFVCDSTLHRVSRWALNAAGTGYTHEVDWEKAGGGSGNGNREFDTPVSLAVDSKNGYVYVAESGNRRVQRLEAQSGNHLTHWVHAYAAPAPPNPFTPTSVAVDARGEVYAADTASHRVVRGTVFEAVGTPRADAAIPRVQGAPWVPRNDPAHMNGPTYVYFAPDGKLWVSDSGNDRVLVFEKNASGELVLAAEQLPAAGLKTPVGVAVDAEGKAFVVDSGNHRIVPYELSGTPPVWAAQPVLGGGQGSADNQFDDPRGIAIAQRAEPILYVADRVNNRVQVLKRNGDFLPPAQKITTGGGTALKQPEDVTVDSLGNVYVADTGNARIAQFDASHAFVREIKVPAPGPALLQPCGVSVDDEDKLIVTDRGLGKVFRVEPDGKLLAFWDLETLLRKRVTPNRDYYPELVRLVAFGAPERAVVDPRGLLVVADKGLDRIRLVRTRTDVSVNLFNLGRGLFDSLPDISFRAVARADYSKDLGLKLEVTDKGIIFDDVNEFETEPEDEFALDHYEHRQVLGTTGGMNAATNAMAVARLMQRWLKHLTRMDEAARRWGTGESKKLSVDLTKEAESNHSWGSNTINLRKDTTGRGLDAWDDSVVAHEMAHWMFDKSVHPFPPYATVGGDHNLDQVSRQNTAITEGYAEYVQFFWGSENGSTDRVRGFRMAGSGTELTTVNIEKDSSKPRIDEFHVGGPSTAAPTWNAPERCLEIEGYFAQAIWQIHHALAEPGILFADSPGFWYPHNTFLTEAQSQRFSNIIRRALRDFPTTPGHSALKNGSRMYLQQVLARAHAESAEVAEIVQSLFELNNVLMPTITFTAGTSETASGTPVGEEIRLHPGETRDIIIQVTDAANLPLRGYNLHLGVGAAARYALKAGAGPDIRHGVNAPASATDLYRATNANGIVNVKFTAPALGAAASITDTMRVTYQPDFDTDRTFSSPEKADDLEKTLRRLYLYELRSAAKTWSGTGNNFGAMVSRELKFVVTPP